MRTYPSQVGVRIPADLDARLRAVAVARGTTVAMVVRLALRAFVEREP